MDKIDTAIIKALMKNGRQSFRRIASQVGVTTPTVESRFRRMSESGIIRKIAPVLDIDKVERGVAALILLKVGLQKTRTVAEKLAPLEEVRNIFTVTGEANMIVRVVTHSNERLQDFLDSKIASIKGANMVSSQVITRTLKDEQGMALFEEMSVSLKCDYCGGEIAVKPYTLNVGGGKRFFCCRTCLSSYKEKYKSRIAVLAAKNLAEERDTHLT